MFGAYSFGHPYFGQAPNIDPDQLEVIQRFVVAAILIYARISATLNSPRPSLDATVTITPSTDGDLSIYP